MTLPSTTTTIAANTDALLAGLESTLDAIPTGAQILKLAKTGDWTYGVDETPVPDGTEWVIHPNSVSRGFIAWGDGEVLGEEMASLASPPIIQSQLPDVGGKWTAQVGFELCALNDPSILLRYSTTSKGGFAAFKVLVAAMQAQLIAKNPAYWPLIELGSSSYRHKTYGRIYTPEFKVTEWVTEADLREDFEALESAQKPETTPEPEPETKPVRKRRRRKS